MEFTRVLVYLALSCGMSAAWADSGVHAEQQTIAPSPPHAKVHNRQMSPLTESTRQGLRLDERDGDGLAWWPDIVFGDGVIEFDVRGNDIMQKSFLGVAFHGADDQTFDAIYFRPFNFRSGDPARRGHGVQYISHPTFTWDRLRAERPNQFEHEVSPAPDPNGWFHVRVVIEHPDVRVFVNDAKVPCLEVKQLRDRKRGWVGVWVGNSSGGSFADLKVTPAQ